MRDTDPEIIDDDLDPEELDPKPEELEELEDEDYETLDGFGEPPNPRDGADDQFGRLRH